MEKANPHQLLENQIEDYKKYMQEKMLRGAQIFSETRNVASEAFEKAKRQNFSFDSLEKMIEHVLYAPFKKINEQKASRIFSFKNSPFEDDFLALQLFAEHDLPQINSNILTIIMLEDLKGQKAACAIKNIPYVTQSVFEGLACIFGAEFPTKKIDLHDTINRFIEITYYKNKIIGDSKKSFDGLPINKKFIIENNVKPDALIESCEGPVGLAIHNWINNTASLAWNLLSETAINGDMPQEAKRWQEHLGKKPLVLSINFYEKADVYILEFRDNGPGLDLTNLQTKLISFLKEKGILYFLESELCPPEMKHALKKACESVYDFYPEIGPYFGDIIKIGHISGRNGHKGLGLWGMEKMLKNINTSCIIGQGGIGKNLDGSSSQMGTYCGIFFPKKRPSSKDYTTQVSEKINNIYA